MKTEKKLSKDNSGSGIYAKLVMRFICISLILIIMIISFITMGWFMKGGFSDAQSIELSADGMKYVLAAEGEAGKYDEYITITTGTGISTSVSVPGRTDAAELISANGGEIRWALNSKSNIENYGTDAEGIYPGSSGTLTFYVIPKQNCDLNINFSLEKILYKNNTDTGKLEIIEDAAGIPGFVKGHILFFKTKENGIYSDRIADGFNIKQEGAITDTAYKFDIHWTWPSVADQLVLPNDDPLLEKNGYKRIISYADTTFYDDIIKNPVNYFSRELEDMNLTEILTNLRNGSVADSFDSDNYKKINELWNEVDQLIGTNVSYIEIRLKEQ